LTSFKAGIGSPPALSKIFVNRSMTTRATQSLLEHRIAKSSLQWDGSS
jgi:hypothetical protein